MMLLITVSECSLLGFGTQYKINVLTIGNVSSHYNIYFTQFVCVCVCVVCVCVVCVWCVCGVVCVCVCGVCVCVCVSFY